MCGIVAVVAERNVVPILLDGLQRLEYRGYDSAGLAVIASPQQIHTVRRQGKVAALAAGVADSDLRGTIGIAHTRWATHGVPCEKNAHPHVVAKRIALVHNGIVENYQDLKQTLQYQDYQLQSDTDSEIVAAALYELVATGKTLLAAVQNLMPKLHGSYAMVLLDTKTPDLLIAMCYGCPLVLGLGVNE